MTCQHNPPPHDSHECVHTISPCAHTHTHTYCIHIHTVHCYLSSWIMNIIWGVECVCSCLRMHSLVRTENRKNLINYNIQILSRLLGICQSVISRIEILLFLVVVCVSMNPSEKLIFIYYIILFINITKN